MRTALAAGLTVIALALSGCGQVSEIAGPAVSAASSEAARQGRQAIDGAVGPVCSTLKRADKSLSALAQGKGQTVAEAKRQIADAQADVEAGAAESIATQAVLAGVASALDGLAGSLAPLNDDDLVPASVTSASEDVTAAIGQAQESLGC